MKKLIILFAFVFGVGYTASAQSDYILISRFMDSVVNQDADEMMDVLHPDCYKEINKLMVQSSKLKFERWNLAGSYTLSNGSTSYIIGITLGEKSPTWDFFGGESCFDFLSPSGNVFVYEVLYVVTNGNRKYVYTNADMLMFEEVENLMNKAGKTLPATYYNDPYKHLK